jgi:hypothetical protein
MSPLTVFVWSLASLAAVAALGLLWLAVKSRDFDAPTPVDFELDDEEDDAETFSIDEIRLWRRRSQLLDEANRLIVEYRSSTPLGHQPYRIAERVDRYFANLEAQTRGGAA